LDAPALAQLAQLARQIVWAFSWTVFEQVRDLQQREPLSFSFLQHGDDALALLVRQLFTRSPERTSS